MRLLSPIKPVSVLALAASLLPGCAAPDLSSNQMSAGAVVGQYQGWNGAPSSLPVAQRQIGKLALRKDGTYEQTLIYGGQTHRATGQWQLTESGWSGHDVVLRNGWGIIGSNAQQQAEVHLSVDKEKEETFLSFLDNNKALSYLKETVKVPSAHKAMQPPKPAKPK